MVSLHEEDYRVIEGKRKGFESADSEKAHVTSEFVIVVSSGVFTLLFGL